MLWAFGALIFAAAVVAGASYLWLSCQVGGAQIDDPAVATALSTPPSNQATIPGPPSGTDILVLGVDRQPTNQGEYIRSDSMMLIHADPDNNYLSILSLPRDLRVEVPGNGTQKLNWAYSHGGADLAIQTVKELTGVDISEYVEVDFQAFRDLTDAVGGVYVDVDKRYFNGDSQYELINLLPGYQKLSGEDALDYVRFRLDSNMDFGRMYRQQRFFTALREEAMGWDMTFKLPGLVNALFDNVQLTLGTNDILGLVYWAVTDLDGDHIRQVTVEGSNQVIDGVWYVIPPEGALQEAVEDLLTPPEPPVDSTTASSTTTETTVTPETGEGGTEGGPTTSDGESEFITDPDDIPDSDMWHDVAAKAPFRVLGPGYLPKDYEFVDRHPLEDAAAYNIIVGDEVEKALKFVYKYTGNENLDDEYLGIMETTWLEAPAASPGRQVEIDGVVYTLVGTSQGIDHVWWKKDGVLYWVSNTLRYVLHSSELLKVAQSMIEIPGGVAR